jgi:ribosomal protein S18 acetylase RimI-like enzyme
MRIRRGRAHDLNAVADLWAACGLTPAPRGFAREIQRKMLSDPDLFLVADDSNEVVGAVMGGFDGRTAWVSRLAVAPDRRREGVARRLIGELERRFAELDAPEPHVLVLDDNEDSRRMWEGLGYVPGPAMPTYRRPA